MARDLVFLPVLARFGDISLLALRIVVGAFLIYGVWDNLVSPARMAELVGFLAKFGFPVPEFMAPLSVWAQFLCGVAFVLGLLTRWAGLICAFNFVVAIAMVDHHAGIRGSFPAAALVMIGLYLAAHGGGSFSMDPRIEHRR